jgi:hypothetical protein
MNSHLSAVAIGVRDSLDERVYKMLVNATTSEKYSTFFGCWSRRSKKTAITIFLIARNRQDAEDALQSAFLKAFDYVNLFDSPPTFRTRLTRIVIKFILTASWNEPVREHSMDWSVDGETWQHWEIRFERADPERKFLNRELEQYLSEAIDRLSPTLKTASEIQRLHVAFVHETTAVVGSCHGNWSGVPSLTSGPCKALAGKS